MIEAIILAAGKGTRMKTDKPKALVEAKGKPMLGYVLEAVREVVDRPHLVVGHKGDDVLSAFGDDVVSVWQYEMKGTGHAVMMAETALKSSPAKHVVVLFADQPLITSGSIRKLIEERERTNAAFTLATVAPENHEGEWSVFARNGRIVRNDSGAIESIVEFKDASDEVKAITEVNVSAYCFDPDWLWRHLKAIQNQNASGEYYLTDLVAIAKAKGYAVVPVILPTKEGMGANSMEELSTLERYL